MVSPADEALLIKYLGHDSDWSKEVQDHINMSKEKLPINCYLTPRDTIDIKENGKAIRVIEPQSYVRISTMDATHNMFYGESDDDNCRGYFHEYNGLAVSGSGDDLLRLRLRLESADNLFHLINIRMQILHRRRQDLTFHMELEVVVE